MGRDGGGEGDGSWKAKHTYERSFLDAWERVRGKRRMVVEKIGNDDIIIHEEIYLYCIRKPLRNYWS